MHPQDGHGSGMSRVSVDPDAEPLIFNGLRLLEFENFRLDPESRLKPDESNGSRVLNKS